jgi:hypothetical protein
MINIFTEPEFISAASTLITLSEDVFCIFLAFKLLIPHCKIS